MGFHHVEIWLPNLASAQPGWVWLFQTLGWDVEQQFPDAFKLIDDEGAYLYVEQSASLRRDGGYDRLRPGVNHIAVTAPDRATVDEIAADCAAHGWSLMFADKHPFAGGLDHYAAYLEDADGFEIEVVAVDD